jgi:hypothetical protein
MLTTPVSAGLTNAAPVHGALVEILSVGGPDGINPDVVSLANNIKTYAEVTGSETYNEIQVEVARAEAFVFLGFQFHPEAMRLLTPPNPLPRMRPVFATAYGMSNEDAAIVQNQIVAMFTNPTPINIVRVRNDLEC